MMDLKISELAKRTKVATSTIRYYVSQGLLPEPKKINKNMSYYDKSCIEKIRAILFLKDTRRYPLSLIKNILKRMDQGLSLVNAEAIENSVFGTTPDETKSLVNEQEFLESTGLTPTELSEAERIELLMPYLHENNQRLYDHEDISFGRDVLKHFLEMGLALKDFDFYIRYGKKIIEQEDLIRKKLVKGTSTKDNINTTVELARRADFTRGYILRRLLQRKTQANIKIASALTGPLESVIKSHK
ncbi:MAG: MerR family transcriptional regulator [Desulfobacterium sp.]|nr:MerR family transcriptional regulator [Desulfobacterium sp.]